MNPEPLTPREIARRSLAALIALIVGLLLMVGILVGSGTLALICRQLCTGKR